MPFKDSQDWQVSRSRFPKIALTQILTDVYLMPDMLRLMMQASLPEFSSH